MTVNCNVTIYHREYDKETRRDIYIRSCHEAWAFVRSGARVSADGFADDSSCIIRIPTRNSIMASVGDLLVVGRGEDIISTADLSDGYSTILTITDNRRGNSPHWRLDCRGDGV